MKGFAWLAHIGENLIDLIIYLFFFCLILYSAYSVWDTYQIKHSALIDQSLLRYKPDIKNPEAPELQQLKEITADVFAWLTIEDTHINYPVVTCQNNTEYLNQNIYGEFSFTGAVFLDCQNHSDMSDTYSIVYAHHMNNGAMFGDIANFLKQDYFQAHTSGTLQTIGAIYDIAFFAICKTSCYDEILCQNPQLINQESLPDMIAYINKIALWKRTCDFHADDHIIALYTCGEGMTNGRLLLLGKLIPQKSI